MKNRIAIIDGLRTPIAKAGGKLRDIQAEALGSFVIKELLSRNDIDKELFDEVIIGNVSQPAHAANIARVIALRSGFDESMTAYTVHRNCASGMESITTASDKIKANNGGIYMCGGVESMSNIPLIYSPKMTSFFENLMKSKTLGQKLQTAFSFRPSALKPVIGLMQGLTDPMNGLIMGKTAEVLAQDFGITREDQDKFALNSHMKATKARNDGILAQEIAPIVYKKSNIMIDDDGMREFLTMDALTKLKPFFDRKNGTVTVGNSSQVSDAAAGVIVMSEKKAKDMGLEPLGYLSSYTYAGLDPLRMGLGPVYSTAKLFKEQNLSLKDIDLIELNEAFAAQVIANLKAFDSKIYAKQHLGTDKALGSIDTNILNVNGGGIALGHPVGMTGTRIVIHTLKELRRRGKNRGLATLCIGGGQGASLILEVE